MKLACVVFMGGKSSRMHSNKAYLPVHGVAMYEKVIQQLSPFGEVYVSIDQKDDRIKYTQIEDIHKDIGPIGGLYSSLLQIDAEAILVCATDVPCIQKQTLQLLVDRYRKKGKVCVAQQQGRLHPLVAIYPKKIVPLVEHHIRQNNYKLRDLLEQCDLEIVEIPGDDLQNINTPADYQKIK